MSEVNRAIKDLEAREAFERLTRYLGACVENAFYGRITLFFQHGREAT